MFIIKPNLYSNSAVIKQSLFNTTSVFGCSSLSSTRHFHYSYANSEPSQREPRVKTKRKGRTKTNKYEFRTDTTTDETDLNIPQKYNSLYEKHAILKEKKGSPSYVFREDIAAKIATKITENRTDPSTPIIEYNPGPALLTKELFKLGAPKIIGIESRREFFPYLHNVQETYGEDKFAFHNWDPFMGNLVDSKKMDKLQQNEINSLHNIKSKKWEQDPYASIVGILNPSKSQLFLRILQILIGSKESLYSFGRPEIFLVVPVKNYRLMMVKDPTQELWTYGRVCCIWNLCFDIETLLEIHKADVFPPFSAKRRLRCESKAFGTVNKDSIYLVKIVPKKDLDPIVNCTEEYSRFSTFLTQITRNKNHRLIPKLESWVPGSGLHMIRMGFNMLHVTGDIRPHKYVEIYQNLKNLPEFKGSSLDAILSAQSLDIESRGGGSKTTDQSDHLPHD